MLTWNILSKRALLTKRFPCPQHHNTREFTNHGTKFPNFSLLNWWQKQWENQLCWLCARRELAHSARSLVKKQATLPAHKLNLWVRTYLRQKKYIRSILHSLCPSTRDFISGDTRPQHTWFLRSHKDLNSWRYVYLVFPGASTSSSEQREEDSLRIFRSFVLRACLCFVRLHPS